jgi:hypothetical protein
MDKMKKEQLLTSIQVMIDAVSVFPNDVSKEYKKGYRNGLEDARRSIIANYINRERAKHND